MSSPNDTQEESLVNDASEAMPSSPHLNHINAPIPGTPQFALNSSENSAVPATPMSPTSPGPNYGMGSTPGTPGSVFGGSVGARSPYRRAIGSPYSGPAPPASEDGEPVVIRGTDINTVVAMTTFRSFLADFQTVEISKLCLSDPTYEDITTPVHAEVLLNDILLSSEASYPLDCVHLYYHSPESRRLYYQLVDFPQEIVPIMDGVVKERVEALRGSDSEEATDVQVRPFHFREISHMRALDPSHIDKMVTLQGMVLRCSPIIPDLKLALFKCCACGEIRTSQIDRGKIIEPILCTCGTKHSFEIVHNRSTFSDKQLVRLQETPDEVPAGETPASVTLFAYDDLVDAIRPGDRVEVTGIFRAMPKRMNPKRTTVRTIFRTYVDVIHFRVLEAGEVGSKEGKKEELDSRGGFSEERVAEIEALSRRPDVYAALTKALAPSIWELDDVKRGTLAMLFGGNTRKKISKKAKSEDTDGEEEEDDIPTNSDTTNKNRIRKRGDVNILLCGDPGTSKSQLLGYVHKIAPRGVYTSGKGSSAVGLTASVVRDPETRELVLESGALVLSDQGVCCIDEFDKMSDTTRAILHEAMEQQTVSIAKAGIICSLNARCSILASANPLESRYNPSLSVVDNIKLPPTLLSRFDLIYLILDQPSAESDRRLAKHLVGLYAENVDPSEQEGVLPQTLLRDYIAYARNNIFPELSDLAGTELISAYLEMRKMGGNPKTISATPRQLESLIRLSEALAKMRLSTVVERKDVQEAVRLMKVATQAAATDPRTGRIDMDMITTGHAALDRADQEQLLDALRDLLSEKRGSRIAVRDVTKAIAEQTNITVQTEEIVEALKVLHNDGNIQFSERNQTVFVRSQIQ